MPLDLGGRSLLSLASLDKKQVLALFELAQEFKIQRQQGRLNLDNRPRSLAIVFFEPSTRTRASFQFAGFNLGLNVYSQFFDSSTSLAKGESEEDTIHNVLALGPDVLVVRYGDSESLDRLLPQLKTPVVNGGSGHRGHPTQALGDLFTVWLEQKDISKQKVLLVGDVGHSRVAASHIELLNKLGIEVGFCAPEDWLTDDIRQLGRVFELEAGMQWCTVCMPLRIQWERHQDSLTSRWRDRELYHKHYGISSRNINKLGDGYLLSPGPINFGWEMSYDLMEDKRCRVLQQVENGVFMRTAILAGVLGIKI